MSRENVKLLYRAHDAFNRRDFDALVGLYHPEIELRPGVVAFDVKSSYRGREEIREFFETITAYAEEFGWEDYAVEPETIIELDDGRVLAVERWHMHSKDGTELNTQITDLYEFRDNLIVRLDGFRDKAEALEAAGLSE
jgi:ketosteroid isomerase-like protein